MISNRDPFPQQDCAMVSGAVVLRFAELGVFLRVEGKCFCLSRLWRGCRGRWCFKDFGECQFVMNDPSAEPGPRFFHWFFAADAAFDQ